MTGGTNPDLRSRRFQLRLIASLLLPLIGFVVLLRVLGSATGALAITDAVPLLWVLAIGLAQHRFEPLGLIPGRRVRDRARAHDPVRRQRAAARAAPRGLPRRRRTRVSDLGRDRQAAADDCRATRLARPRPGRGDPSSAQARHSRRSQGDDCVDHDYRHHVSCRRERPGRARFHGVGVDVWRRGPYRKLGDHRRWTRRLRSIPALGPLRASASASRSALAG